MRWELRSLVALEFLAFFPLGLVLFCLLVFGSFPRSRGKAGDEGAVGSLQVVMQFL